MPNVNYSEIFNGLKDAVVSQVKQDAEQFLADNQDAVKFLEEQARDIAQLGVDYAKATSDDQRKSIIFDLKLVEQSVKNKLAGIAVQAEATARASFQRTVMTVLSTVVKLVPVVLSAI